VQPRPIRVPKTATVAQVERLISSLEGKARAADLVLPTVHTMRELGGTAALLQLIITWHRRCPDGSVRLHVNPSHDDEAARVMVRRFIARDHGLVAFNLAGRLTDLTAERDLTKIAHDELRARFIAIAEGKVHRGTKAFVVAADNTAWSRPPMLYPRPEAPDAVGDAADMAATLADIDDTISQNAWHLLAFAAVPAVGVLLEELVKNTHQWARKDAEDRAYVTSVRGLRIEAHNERDAEALVRAAGDDARLLRWVRSAADRQGRLRLVELTVFDSGPGLPARALKRIEGDEYEALQWCLRLHYSTSRAPGRGIGLHQCLATLSELGAFLRVRCLSLERWRDFRAEPYRPGADPREPYLKEMDRRVAGGPSGRAEGTSYTILVPATPA
jgi:hypothetical protein